MSATDAAAFPYAVQPDIKFDALDVIDVPSLVEACTDQWYNQTLCKVKRFSRASRRHAGRVPLAQAR